MARGARRADTRIGDAARASATSTSDTALWEGRLDLAEYERRLVVVQAARVHQDLTPAVAGLPVRSGQTGPGLRIEAAAAGGLLDPTERHDRVAAARRATTDAQLAALVADLSWGRRDTPLLPYWSVWHGCP
jgi:hypothetical protein